MYLSLHLFLHGDTNTDSPYLSIPLPVHHPVLVVDKGVPRHHGHDQHRAHDEGEEVGGADARGVDELRNAGEEKDDADGAHDGEDTLGRGVYGGDADAAVRHGETCVKAPLKGGSTG